MDPPDGAEILRQNALAYGFTDEEARIFAELAQIKIREAVERHQNGETITLLQIAESIKELAAEESIKMAERQRQALEQGINPDDMKDEDMPDADLQDLDQHPDGARRDPCIGIDAEFSDGGYRLRFRFDQKSLEECLGKDAHYTIEEKPRNVYHVGLKKDGVDLITALCQRIELAVELAKHLGPKDILNLYSVSRTFYETINGHLLSSVHQIISYKAPEAGRIFDFRLYRKHLVPDPAERTWAQQFGPQHRRFKDAELRQVRLVPGVKYLQLVLVRDRCCRDILAMMARHGHRTPPGTYRALLRIWLIMDISTSRQRAAVMRNEVMWTDLDLYNAQLFFMKLGMFFNDPIYGTLTHDMTNIFLGQRSLFSLWQVLMRKHFTSSKELMNAKVRYDFEIPPEILMTGLRNPRVFGVPLHLVGKGHLEAWGKGADHLMRPDELVPYEAVLRGLELDDHLMHMLTWGYWDWNTGENLVPTEDEMYFSDEEKVLADVETSFLWQRKHAMKKRWSKLSPEEQQEIRRDDEDDYLHSLVWAVGHPGDTEAETLQREPSLDDEINRGCIVHKEESPLHGSQSKLKAPSLTDDPSAWAEFGNRVLLNYPPEFSEDELLRAESWNNHRPEGEEADWDWTTWLGQHERERAAADAASTGETAESGATDDEGYDEDDEYSSFDEGDDDDDDEDDDSPEFEIDAVAGGNQGEDGRSEEDRPNVSSSGQDGIAVNQYSFTAQEDEDRAMMNDEELEKCIDDFFDHVMMDGVEQG
ncbi:hypothetical protein HIM_00282 [Hirsutella minnesotensis 3608]|nr:hypothetical protein HIM_00282 [Hirsutella minnesotensis 3608]